MGIDRIIQDQKEKSTQKRQLTKMEQNKSSMSKVLSTQPFDNKVEGISQHTENKDNYTTITRSPEHQEKIDKVKRMFNLK